MTSGAGERGKRAGEEHDMDDERQDGARGAPLWPGESAATPGAAPQRPQPDPFDYPPFPPYPPDSDAPIFDASPPPSPNTPHGAPQAWSPATPGFAPAQPPQARQSAGPQGRFGERRRGHVSEAQTERISAAPPVAPGFGPPDLTRLSTERMDAVTPPRMPASALAQGGRRSTPPEGGRRPTSSAASDGAPPGAEHTPTSPTPRRGRSLRWRVGLALAVVALLLAGAGGLYAYAASLAAAPQRIVNSYCADLTQARYQAAYNLLSPEAQAQTTPAQFTADAAARDTIQGRVTGCVGASADQLSALSFLRAPRSTLFNARITRAGATAATGQIALTRNATGWHVAQLSPGLAGIDLGPLHTEQALCQALAAGAYGTAYGLLSAPYQREQGSDATFTRDFGGGTRVTQCANDLKTYTVNQQDQQASFSATLTVTVAGGGASGATGAFTLPVKIALVREAAGWRVDTIAPQLAQ